VKDEEIVRGFSESELPSRASRYGKKRKGSERGLWGRLRKRSSGRTVPDQSSKQQMSHEALWTYREQAAGLGFGEGVAQPMIGEERRARRRFSQRAIVWLLALSLLFNVGQGLLVYRLLQQNLEDKHRFATPQPAPAISPQPMPDVVRISQPIRWTQAQQSGISKEQRMEIEEQFSQLYDPQHFPKGSVNMLFAAGLNNFVRHHDGSISLSFFLHNGYLRNVKPKVVNISAYYEGRLLLNGSFDKKLEELMSGEVHLCDLVFKPDDIRDPKTVDRLVASPGEQAKLRFDVRLSYDHYVNKDQVEEIWMILTPQTVQAPKVNQIKG
jgi:hypothetical protein